MSDLDADRIGGGTDVLDKELEKLLEGELTEDGDHDLFAHYVQKDKIVESAVTGQTGARPLRQEVDSGPRPVEVPGVPRLPEGLRPPEVTGRC